MRGRGTVVESMTKMAAASPAMNFGARLDEFEVGARPNRSGQHGTK